MMILMTGVLAICLLLVSFPGQSFGIGKDAGKIWLKANIVLDAGGKLTSIQWLDTKPTGGLMRAPLENVVRGWEFEPGKLNGVPAITQTGLSLEMTLKKTGKDKFVLYIDDARTGPISDTWLAPPSYPINQVYAGASAYIDLVLDIDEAGKVVAATVADYAESSSSKSSRKQFETAALGVAYSWKFQPEIVGGKPRAAKLNVPITFCLDGWCAMHERRIAASGKAVLPSGTSVAVDSEVKILTRTSVVEI